MSTTRLKNEEIRVQVGPANYFSHVGALSRIDDFFSEKALSESLVIAGAKAFEAARPYFPASLAPASDRAVLYQGHCSESGIKALAKLLPKGKGPVIGIGGGAVIDTAKALAARKGRDFVAIPTVAATCAAWTPLSVWYDNAGFARYFELFRNANFLVLVEPRIIQAAPSRYLIAGIADTLAKWYEACILIPKNQPVPLTARLGLELSASIKDLLLKKGSEALDALGKSEPTDTLVEVIDAIIAGAGAVGGFGERFTRVAAAHAVHNGLTVLPQTKEVLHGAKVAYGLLVQLALEGQKDELISLQKTFRNWSLPVSLSDMGVDIKDAPSVAAFRVRALQQGESIHQLSFVVSQDLFDKAIQEVELLAKK